MANHIIEISSEDFQSIISSKGLAEWKTEDRNFQIGDRVTFLNEKAEQWGKIAAIQAVSSFVLLEIELHGAMF